MNDPDPPSDLAQDPTAVGASPDSRHVAADLVTQSAVTGWLLPVAAVVLALLVRGFVAMRTVVPGRDTATYLDMARRAAAGEFEALWSTVFHPVYPGMVGVVLRIWPETNPVVAGQVTACVCGALAAWPLVCLAARFFGVPAAWATAGIYGFGGWFVRHDADALSEGAFQLFVLTAACWLIGSLRARARGAVAREHALVLGAAVFTALAYGTRPEGLSLAVCGTVALLSSRPWSGAVVGGCPARMRALQFATVTAAVAVLFPLGWASFGPGFTWTPKAAFNWAVGAGAAEGGGIGHYAFELLRLPLVLFEEFGFLVFPLLLLGLWHAPPRGTRRVLFWLLVAPFVLQCLVAPALRAHWRFFAGYGAAMLPFAGWGLVVLARRATVLRSALGIASVVLVIGSEAVRCWPERRQHRTFQPPLGAWIDTQMTTEETLVTPMPRLMFYSGRAPLPPRPIPGSEVLLRAQDPSVRFVVFVPARVEVNIAEFDRLGFRPAQLPAELRALVDARGALVLQRRR